MLRLIQIIFFVALLFSFNGLLFNQNVEATVCDSPFYYVKMPLPNYAYLLITVTDIEKETGYASYNDVLPPQYIVSHIDFSIDKVISDNKDFSLKNGSMSIYVTSVEIGEQYVIVSYYDTGDNRWIFLSHSSCNPSITSTLFIDYFAFYEDWINYPCDLDKTYLIKYSSLKKVCVSEDTGNILIERDYGFYLPRMSYYAWEDTIENRNNADYNVYKHSGSRDNLECSGHSILNKDHCAPIMFSLQFDKKGGDTDVSFSNLPNLGETAIITISDANPMPLEELEKPEEGRISLDANIEFVDAKADFDFIHTGETLFYNTTVRAVNQGNTLIEVGYENGADRIRLHISNNTTEGWPLTYEDNKKVTVSLLSDKKQYHYPEPVIISGQFDTDVGNSFAFLDTHRNNHIYIDLSESIDTDSENRFIFQIDKEVFEKMDDVYDQTDSYYLALQDRYGGIYEIDFAYSINDEIREFMYWKHELGYTYTDEHLRDSLSEIALFTEIEIQRFMEIYPELNQSMFKYPLYLKDQTVPPTIVPDIIELEQHNKTQYKQPSEKERIEQHRKFIEFIVEGWSDDDIGSVIVKLSIDDIRSVVEEKQYSKEKLREILENEKDLPKTYIERVIEKIFNSK